jgi:hypothetical protein
MVATNHYRGHCLSRSCLRGSSAMSRSTALSHPETFNITGCECPCQACYDNRVEVPWEASLAHTNVPIRECILGLLVNHADEACKSPEAAFNLLERVRKNMKGAKKSNPTYTVVATTGHVDIRDLGFAIAYSNGAHYGADDVPGASEKAREAIRDLGPGETFTGPGGRWSISRRAVP